jgi:hypothetical protein
MIAMFLVLMLAGVAVAEEIPRYGVVTASMCFVNYYEIKPFSSLSEALGYVKDWKDPEIYRLVPVKVEQKAVTRVITEMQWVADEEADKGGKQ